MPKKVQFGQFLKTWSLRSNSVNIQVTFNSTKIDGKCQNSNATFWVIFKQCALLLNCSFESKQSVVAKVFSQFIKVLSSHFLCWMHLSICLRKPQFLFQTLIEVKITQEKMDANFTVVVLLVNNRNAQSPSKNVTLS